MNRGRSQGWGARVAASKAAIKSGSQRAEWQRAVNEARALTLAGALTLEQRAGFLRGSVRSLSSVGFPAEAGHSARLLAESFLKACDAFEIATGDAKAETAAVIAAIAAPLDRRLQVALPSSDAMRARYGERD